MKLLIIIVVLSFLPMLAFTASAPEQAQQCKDCRQLNRTIACPSALPLGKMLVFNRQGDSKAAVEVLYQGKCKELPDKTIVYLDKIAESPGWATAVRLPGSPQTLWVLSGDISK